MVTILNMILGFGIRKTVVDSLSKWATAREDKKVKFGKVKTENN